MKRIKGFRKRLVGTYGLLGALLFTIAVACSIIALVGVAAAAEADGGAYAFSGFRLVGDVLFPDETFADLFSSYTDRLITFSELETLVTRVEDEYHRRGYTLAIAFLPEQEVTDGVVDIGVLAGRYGDVRWENESRLRTSVAERALRGIVIGEPVYMPALDGRIAVLESLPGVRAESAFVAGAQTGETDLIVHLLDASPMEGSVSIELTGPDLWQDRSISGQVTWNNPTGRGDQTSFSISTNGRTTAGIQLGYELPIGAGLESRLASSARVSRYRLDGVFAGLGGGGSDGLTIALERSWSSLADASIEGRLELGYRRNFEEIVGSFSSTTYTTVEASLEWRRASSRASGLHMARIGIKGGNLALGTDQQEDADDLTAQTSGLYGVVRGEATWTAAAGPGRLSVDLTGQWATKNLGLAEKFSITGRSGVRALASGRSSGDDGWRLQASYVHAQVEAGDLPGYVQYFGFLDAGSVTYNKRPWDASGVGGRFVYGAGVGLRWAMSEQLTLEAHQGWLLGDSAGQQGTGLPGPLRVDLSYSF